MTSPPVARFGTPAVASAAAVLLGLVLGAVPARLALADPGRDAAQTASTAGPGESAEATTAAAEQPAQPVPAAPMLIADINLSTQTMAVRIDGRQLYHWRVSSGRAGYRTPVGTFRPEWMARMWYSRQYDLAPMPHAVFFKSGAAIHGTSATGLLGRPASHGCIRLAPANAATFYRLVRKHGLAATRIMVHGSPPPGRDHIESDARQLTAQRGDDRYIYYGYPSVAFRPGAYAYPPQYPRYVPRARFAPRRYERVPLHWR